MVSIRRSLPATPAHKLGVIQDEPSSRSHIVCSVAADDPVQVGGAPRDPSALAHRDTRLAAVDPLLAHKLSQSEVGTLPIMSWSEYRARPWPERYVLELNQGSSKLLYFGVNHSRDPAHPQFLEVETAWDRLQPDIAFTEGGVWPLMSTDRTQSIERSGEPGLVTLLAARDGVPVRSLEPSFFSEVRYLLNRFSADEVLLFFVLRDLSHLDARPEDPSNAREIRCVAEESLVNYRDLCPLLASGPVDIDALARALCIMCPEIESLSCVPRSYFNPSLETPLRWTNEVARSSNAIRDHHMVTLLHEAMARHKRVFAMVGWSHVAIQEPALRHLLSSRGLAAP